MKRKQKRNVVWVVEWEDVDGNWYAQRDHARDSRIDATGIMEGQRARWPEDKFRVTKYVAVR